MVNVNWKRNSTTTFLCTELRYPKQKLTLVEKGPHYMGKKIINGLPQCLKKIENENFDRLLIQRCPYTVEVFYFYSEYAILYNVWNKLKYICICNLK